MSGGERGVRGKVPHPHHRPGGPPAHQKVGHLIFVIVLTFFFFQGFVYNQIDNVGNIWLYPKTMRVV